MQEIVRLEITRQRQEALVRDAETELVTLRDRNSVLEVKLVGFESAEAYKKQIDSLTEDLKTRDEDYEVGGGVCDV